SRQPPSAPRCAARSRPRPPPRRRAAAAASPSLRSTSSRPAARSSSRSGTRASAGDRRRGEPSAARPPGASPAASPATPCGPAGARAGRAASRLWVRRPCLDDPADRGQKLASIVHTVAIAGSARTDRERTPAQMDYKLELITVPVSDVDRAKAFYADQAGFVAEHDHQVEENLRFVQLTPPGSACSIAIGSGLTEAAPGSVQGLQLVVADADAAHAELAGRGVQVS